MTQPLPPEERVGGQPGARLPSIGPSAPEAEPELASLGRRLLAGLIDFGIGWLLVGIAVYAAEPQVEAGNLTRGQQQTVGLVAVITISVWINYMVFAEWHWGRTIGKAALGLRVIPIAGDDLSWNAALVRNLLRLPDLVAIFLTVPASEHGQRLGDRAARTMVLRWREAPALQQPSAPADWGATTVLVGLGLLLAVTIVAAGIASALDPDLKTLGAVLALQAVLAAAMAGVPFVLTRRAGRADPAALGLGPSLRSPVRTAVLAYLAYLAFALVISALLSPEQEDITRELGVDKGALGAVAAFFLIVIAAPVAEEVFFRGFMFAGIRAHGSFAVAALISAGVWGLFHYTGSGSWPVVLQLSIFGVILAAVYERTGSIRPAIALHMLNNAIAFAVLVSS